MKFIKVLFLLLIILIAALIVLYFFAGSLFKGSLTRTSPALLGVPVSLEGTTVDPLRGKVEIQDLQIHNPPSFDSEYAFQLGTFRLQMDPLSVFGDTLHIREFEIVGASILSDGLRADNHQTILKHLQSKLPASKAPESSENEPTHPRDGKKVIIDHFAFLDSELIVMLDGEVITRVDFPAVTLDHIGSKGNALTLAEALTQIYSAIASETTRVLTINEEVIENIGRAKLKSLGIDDVKDLKNPKRILEDPEKLENLLEALTAPDSASDRSGSTSGK